MVGREALAIRDVLAELRERFLASVAVQKVKHGARQVIVSDKDGTIQQYPKPVADPSQKEIQAGRRLRKRVSHLPFIECSAQTLDLAINAKAHAASRQFGYRRAQPRILMPDGSVVRDPGLVNGWEYHLNPDGFLGYGTGNYYLLGDGYFADVEYDDLLGGRSWRPKMFDILDRIYSDNIYLERLSAVDRGNGDVDELDFRIEFRDNDREAMDFLRLNIDTARLRGQTNAVWIDESKPWKNAFTTYLVPEFAQKSHALERFGNALSYFSGVPSEELEYIVIGDQGHDVATGLKALQGAKKVGMIVAADSPMVARIETNGIGTDEQWGYPLPGGPNDPDEDYRGFYKATDMPGIYHWYGPRRGRPREVILAEQTPWFEPGMCCTESVEVVLAEYFGLQ